MRVYSSYSELPAISSISSGEKDGSYVHNQVDEASFLRKGMREDDVDDIESTLPRGPLDARVEASMILYTLVMPHRRKCL